MRVGDRVVLVHGLAPDGCEPVTLASEPRHGDGKVMVRLPSGGTVWCDPGWLDPGVLPSQPRHRTGDPDTARMAAHAAAERLTEHQWAVLAALVDAGRAGLIDHEHEARNGLIQTSAGKRRKELERLGLVEPTGQRRHTPTKHLAAVYRVSARGLLVWQHHQRGAA